MYIYMKMIFFFIFLLFRRHCSGQVDGKVNIWGRCKITPPNVIFGFDTFLQTTLWSQNYIWGGRTDLNYTSKKIVTDRKIYKAIAMLKNIVLHTFLKTIYCYVSFNMEFSVVVVFS